MVPPSAKEDVPILSDSQDWFSPDMNWSQGVSAKPEETQGCERTQMLNLIDMYETKLREIREHLKIGEVKVTPSSDEIVNNGTNSNKKLLSVGHIKSTAEGTQLNVLKSPLLDEKEWRNNERGSGGGRDIRGRSEACSTNTCESSDTSRLCDLVCHGRGDTETLTSNDKDGDLHSVFVVDADSQRDSGEAKDKENSVELLMSASRENEAAQMVERVGARNRVISLRRVAGAFLETAAAVDPSSTSVSSPIENSIVRRGLVKPQNANEEDLSSKEGSGVERNSLTSNTGGMLQLGDSCREPFRSRRPGAHSQDDSSELEADYRPDTDETDIKWMTKEHKLHHAGMKKSIGRLDGKSAEPIVKPESELQELGVKYMSLDRNWAASQRHDAGATDNSHGISRTSNITQMQLLTDQDVTHDVESLDKFSHRAGWLVALLLIQSSSSVILKSFQVLIQRHPIVVYFLTMLIGAGGNAGSQCTVLAIRGIAMGKIGPGTTWRFLSEQLIAGLGLAFVLSAASFLRLFIFRAEMMEILAVCVSMWSIVMTSILFGAILPLVLRGLGIDPAHAGAAIQVIMDITGSLLTCFICWIILDKIKVPSSQFTLSQ